MIFDMLVLGIGAIGRKIKDDNIKAEGKRVLKERESKSLWEQAKDSSAMITINGINHNFITPHEIYLNEKYWDSGMSLHDFCVKFYIDNNKCWVSSVPRLFEKDGTYQTVFSFNVVEWYNEYKTNGKIKNLYYLKNKKN